MLNGNRMKSTRGRHVRDFYTTPIELAISAMHKFAGDEGILYKDMYGLDAGCGTGVWGLANISMPNKLADGIDINPQVIEIAKSVYDEIITGDFLDYGQDGYDVVFGNPPYSLAEEFIRHSLDLVVPNGYVYFLLRLSFLEGIKRGKGFFQEYPPKIVYVCSRRPSFYMTNGRNTTDTLAYAMFLWQKGWEDKPEIDWLDWEYEKDYNVGE
jgi:SAM-dependent methyltransferase